MGTKYVLTFDSQKCVGCNVCAIACSLRHTGTCNPARARLRVDTDEDIGLTFMRVCHRCKKPPCKDACPEEALSKDPDTGVMVLDEERCIGCGECIAACPFGAMFLDPATEFPIVCDLCRGDPACYKFCSIKAISYKPSDSPTENFYEKKLAQAFANPVIQASVYKEEEGYYQKPKGIR